MFQKDLAYSKIERLAGKKQQDYQELTQLLSENYLRIKNIFVLLASNSSYPTVTVNDATEFLRKSALFGKEINLARADQIFIATNVSSHKYKQNSERVLHRYEFMEFLVRLAQAKYVLTKPSVSLPKAVAMLLDHHIYPNNHAVDGVDFRSTLLYPNWLITELFA